MRRSRRVVRQREPARQARGEVDGVDWESEWRCCLSLSYVNSGGVEPDNMAVIIVDRGSVVVVRLEMTMRDARVVGRIRLVDVFRGRNPRAQHRDSG